MKVVALQLLAGSRGFSAALWVYIRQRRAVEAAVATYYQNNRTQSGAL